MAFSYCLSLSKARNSESRAPSTSSGNIRGEVEAARVYSLDRIDGIQDVFHTVESLERPSFQGGQPARTTGVVQSGGQGVIASALLPHHTLIAEQIGEFWTDIATTTDPSVIVIIGPAHQNQGESQVMVTDGAWTTPFGNVASNTDLVDTLEATGAVALDREAFENEHSVGLHMPYVAKLFPDTPVVGVLAKSYAGETEARAFVEALNDVLPEDALVIASIDFSHYLPSADMDRMDEETLALISARNYRTIDGLQSDHLDSPFTLETYFLLGDSQRWSQELLWHENSGRLTSDFSMAGTSYLVYFARSKPSLQNPAPITLSLAGDMMLGRGVAQALARTTVQDAFGKAATLFEGSDLAFANLESVLTDSNNDTGKAIFFKGDPARVDVLHLFGLTHVSVANNHVDDYGKAGWQDSVENVRASGIEPIGGYNNNGNVVLWPSTPVERGGASSGSNYSPSVVEGASVAFLAYNDTTSRVDLDQLSSDVASAAEQADRVVVSFHWGVEYVHTPTKRQTELAHAAIDAGATLVVGHHPHVLQGVEKYNQGLILYSLGNFIFDQIGEDQNESMVVRVTFDEQGSTAEFLPVRIRGGFPVPATETESIVTLERLAEWSEPWGTTFVEGTVSF